MSKNILAYCLTAVIVGCAVSTVSAAEFKRSEITTTTAEDCRREAVTLYSASMERDIGVVVVLPPEYDKHPDKQYPIIYGMHGSGSPYTSIAGMGPMLQRLENKPMIVACFDGGNTSFYVDAPGDGTVPKSIAVRQPRGKRPHHTDEQYAKLESDWAAAPDKVKSLYVTFFFDELVPALGEFYRIDGKKQAATGFSMGGFGAMHLALERPEAFTSISGMSSVFYDEAGRKNSMARRRSSLKTIYGAYDASDKNQQATNHFKRVEELIKSGKKFPAVYQHCGSRDGLLAVNKQMRDHLKELGCEVVLKESDGSHNWTFWKNASGGVADFHWEHFDKE